jgi:hypothetical protein
VQAKIRTRPHGGVVGQVDIWSIYESPPDSIDHLMPAGAGGGANRSDTERDRVPGNCLDQGGIALERRLYMSMPKNEAQQELENSWRIYLTSLEKAVGKLEIDIREASEMANICTDEWCLATEHVIDDLSNALFSISEPRWSDQDDSRKIKELKRRVRDLYADYRNVYTRLGSA